MFDAGDTARQMFFLKSGSLTYIQLDGKMLQPPIEEGQWISEPVMWTRWRHLGECRVEALTELILIDSTAFSEVLCAHPKPWAFAHKYAKAFIEQLNREDPQTLTDVLRDTEFYLVTVPHLTKQLHSSNSYAALGDIEPPL
eukprot:gnl/TRDRNA2_/TRDRNA2_175115_c3_seq1.p1 gnl/TRDRNA2_/TRDRNA2_175115_c3~~gnl/TRDRNA2_/TRDRNA2_175115_c3_seq1.p1  ORF type:complete len:155 (-),score=19.50 gnl/TRDRNA2_/TRDRNA2_175115_c3_seq1:177-599(-)